jgi:SAM-dependent methyltransferase
MRVICETFKYGHLVGTAQSNLDLPTREGNASGDTASSGAHAHILSPFSAVMITPDEKGVMRNPLVNELLGLPVGVLETATIADFGCGPGNLIPFLEGRTGRITGVDENSAALNSAQRLASRHGITFDARQCDLRDLDLGQRFDLIISVNSIIPQERKDVHAILSGIRRHLYPGGKVMAILPSFDAIIYLQRLWEERFTEELGDVEKARKAVLELFASKRTDGIYYLYAPDGVTRQSYHTENSIRTEFRKAGLGLTQAPQKVRYPWDLAQQFGYGRFPNASQEVWDWYVVAEPV